MLSSRRCPSRRQISGSADPVRFLLAALSLMVMDAFADADSNLTALSGAGFETELAGKDVIFCARDAGTGQEWRFQPSRGGERHRPFSTFKIANLVIALESGVARSLDDERPWRIEHRPPMDFWPESWKQDQTLASAFRRSAVWYFRDLALEIGGDRYRWWLDHFNYGNGLAPDGNDLFWLNGPLALSPCEQVTFIEGLWAGRFRVSARTLAALHEVSLIEEFPAVRLYGKTGSGSVGAQAFDSEFEGWLVGWVERDQADPVAYALYVRGPDYRSIEQFRKRMSIAFLRASGVLPE